MSGRAGHGPEPEPRSGPRPQDGQRSTAHAVVLLLVGGGLAVALVTALEAFDAVPPPRAAATAPVLADGQLLLATVTALVAIAALVDRLAGPGPARRVGRGLAAAAVLAAAALLVAVLLPGADRMAARIADTRVDPLGPGARAHALLSIGALAAVAVALTAGPGDRARRRARGWAGAALVTAVYAFLIATLGRVDDAPDGRPEAFLPGLAVVLLACGVLLRDPERAPWRWFVGTSPGDRVARFGFLLAVAVPTLLTLGVFRASVDDTLTASEAASATLVGISGAAIVAIGVVSRAFDRHRDQQEMSRQALRGAATWETVGTFRTGADGRITEPDDRFCAMVGADPADVVGAHWTDVVAPEERGCARSAWHHAVQERTTAGGRFALVGADGERRTVDLAVAPVVLVRGADQLAWVGTCFDVTRLHHVEGELEGAERRRRAAVDRSPAGVAELTLDGRWLSANRAICEMLGRDEDELLGRPVGELLAQDDAARTALGLRAFRARERDTDSGELTYLRGPGDARRVRFTSVPVHDEAGRPERLMVHLFDVTARHRAETTLQRALDEDATTGLHSRQWLDRTLHRALEDDLDGPAGVAVVLLDIDRFQDVNDGYGAAVGDDVLRGVARIVREECAGVGEAARIGGDQVVVLLTGSALDRASVLARRVVDAIATASWAAGDARIAVSACAGVAALAPGETGDAGPATELMALADGALREAKASGPGQLVVRRRAEDAARPFRERLAWASRLRRALAAEAFTVHVQPIVGLADGRPTQVEALVRLDDRPGEPPLVPGDFLEVAERYGLLARIDALVLERAAALLVDDRLPADCRVAVNVSAGSIDAAGTPRRIERALATAGADPRRLVLEVTETTAIRDQRVARRFAGRMSDLGCRLALDDFGTGYASFASLKALRYDEVKLDGVYVRDLAHQEADQLLVRAIVDLARGLGMRTVAEVVEDARTWHLLRALGVDAAQGYLIGRPGPVEEVVRRMRLFVPPAVPVDPRLRLVRPADRGA